MAGSGSGSVATVTSHAHSRAVCRQASYRPETPAWPATSSVRKTIGASSRSPAPRARSRATYLAGSVTRTRVSLKLVVTSSAGSGCPPGSAPRFSYGD